MGEGKTNALIKLIKKCIDVTFIYVSYRVSQCEDVVVRMRKEGLEVICYNEEKGVYNFTNRFSDNNHAKVVVC